MICSKLNSISYHAQSSPIVSLHAQFTVSYHLPHFQFPRSRLVPGSAKMLISLLTDRNDRCTTNAHNIYRTHALLKKVGGRRSVAGTRNCGEIHEADGISRDFWLRLSDKLHFRAGIERFSR